MDPAGEACERQGRGSQVQRIGCAQRAKKLGPQGGMCREDQRVGYNRNENKKAGSSKSMKMCDVDTMVKVEGEKVNQAQL